MAPLPISKNDGDDAFLPLTRDVDGFNQPSLSHCLSRSLGAWQALFSPPCIGCAMKLTALICFCITFAISSALTQALAPHPVPGTGSQAQSPNLNNSTAAVVKELREQCRTEANVRTGRSAKRVVVQECFAQSRPNLAAKAQCCEQRRRWGLPVRIFARLILETRRPFEAS
jgi:hypothetical protein